MGNIGSVQLLFLHFILNFDEIFLSGHCLLVKYTPKYSATVCEVEMRIKGNIDKNYSSF